MAATDADSVRYLSFLPLPLHLSFPLPLLTPSLLPMFLTHLRLSYPLHIPLSFLPSLPLPTIWCSSRAVETYFNPHPNMPKYNLIWTKGVWPDPPFSYRLFMGDSVLLFANLHNVIRVTINNNVPISQCKRNYLKNEFETKCSITLFCYHLINISSSHW